jgi:hypothetical protein
MKLRHIADDLWVYQYQDTDQYTHIREDGKDFKTEEEVRAFMKHFAFNPTEFEILEDCTPFNEVTDCR